MKIMDIGTAIFLSVISFSGMMLACTITWAVTISKNVKRYLDWKKNSSIDDSSKTR